jgi:hypothetical protein
MSASSQHHPSVPSQPPRTASHLLAITLLVLALIITASVLTVWIGLRYLTRGVSVNVEERGRGTKAVSIKTPVGSLEVNQDVDEAHLGLPIYPGATRLKEGDSANVNLAFGDEAHLRVVAAKFETPDSLEKVKDYYKSRLGSEVTKFVEKDQRGETVFEIKRKGLEKVVALQEVGGKTQIALVRVAHGSAETN